MLNYLKQNKHVVMVAIAMFIVSMSTLMFFFGSDKELQKNDFKANVIEMGVIRSEKDQEKKFRAMLHNDKDPFVIISAQGNIEFESKNFETILGYSQQELTNQLIFLYLNNDDFSIVFSAFAKVLQTRETVNVIGPYHLRDKAGIYHLHVGSALPVTEHGKVISVALISKDIGEAVAPVHAPTQPDLALPPPALKVPAHS